jgi:hypothetical protein
MPLTDSIVKASEGREAAAVVAKGALRAAAHLRISNRRLADIVGLSGSSMSRLAQGAFQASPSTWRYCSFGSIDRSTLSAGATLSLPRAGYIQTIWRWGADHLISSCMYLD